MFPLLALGLLAGNQWMKLRREDQREQDRSAAIQGLFGRPGEAMGPPAEDGSMGYGGGTGLLADPSSPQRQAEFAAGIMGLPGLENIGANLLAGGLQRQQQQQQFDTQESRLGRQFDIGTSQWERQFDASRGDARLAAEQWLAQFQQQREDNERRFGFEGARLGMDQQRLGMERERLALDRGRFEREGQPKAGDPYAGLPKLSPNWMYTDSASGVVAAPVPGSTPYAEAVGVDETLANAQRRLNTLVDMIGGKETTTPQGNKVRTGGKGTELWGKDAATYSILRGQVISDYAKLNDMGVLQAGEFDTINDRLPDPTTLGSAVFSRNKSTIKAYETLRDEFKAKREAHRRANPWLVPPPPKGTELRP